MKNLSLKSRLFFVTALVVLTYAVFSVLFIDIFVKDILKKKRIANGTALATTIAAHVADSLLTRDFFAISAFFDDILKTNPEVSYIFIEKDGQVLLHTFKGGFPPGLLNAGHRKTAVDYVAITTDEGAYHDFAASLFGGRTGTLRLGITGTTDEQITKETKKSLLFVALLVMSAALVFIAIVSRRLTLPLSQLTQSAVEIANGEYSRTIPVLGDDEVGRLALAFGKMVDAVRIRQQELMDVNEELETVNVRLHEYIGEVGRTRDELIKSKQDAAAIDTARSFLHHSRQPLTYLIMAIELLSEELGAERPVSTDSVREKLRAVQDAGQRLSVLLKKFEQLKEYRTVTYDSATKIIDIDTD
ncbi:MAG: HAMP domain-containing protein [Nitrospiraceae bacterium]|nr:HAMP domain-containing protein [Nitrospiraceae bacterium]